MSGWGMDPPSLYSNGASIAGLGDDAQSAGKSLLTAISDAETTVHHPTVTAALGRFHTSVSRPANQLGHDVRALGSQVQTTATTGASADHDSNTALNGVGTSALETGSVLRRPVNVPN